MTFWDRGAARWTTSSPFALTGVWKRPSSRSKAFLVLGVYICDISTSSNANINHSVSFPSRNSSWTPIEGRRRETEGNRFQPIPVSILSNPSCACSKPQKAHRCEGWHNFSPILSPPPLSPRKKTQLKVRCQILRANSVHCLHQHLRTQLGLRKFLECFFFF